MCVISDTVIRLSDSNAGLVTDLISLILSHAKAVEWSLGARLSFDIDSVDSGDTDFNSGDTEFDLLTLVLILLMLFLQEVESQEEIQEETEEEEEGMEGEDEGDGEEGEDEEGVEGEGEEGVEGEDEEVASVEGEEEEEEEESEEEMEGEEEVSDVTLHSMICPLVASVPGQVAWESDSECTCIHVMLFLYMNEPSELVCLHTVAHVTSCDHRRSTKKRRRRRRRTVGVAHSNPPS